MMDKQQMATIREHLVQRRRTLLEDVEDLEATLLALEESRPIEMAEEAQEVAASINLKALDEKQRIELLEIGRALSKLESGEYGLCEKCGKKIPEERLKALPAVRYCIRCQQRIEQRGSS